MRLSTLFVPGSLALAVALSATPLEAAPILGTAGAGLHTIGSIQENQGRYWDGNSWDSDSILDGQAANPCSAGSFAAGSPCSLNAGAIWSAQNAGNMSTTVSVAGGNAGFQDWRQENGAADMNYAFGNTGGGLFDFTMLGEFTDDWNVNEIGWYEVDNPQNRHTIFGSSAAIGSTAQVFIPGNFGFYYLNTSGNGEVFYTQSMFNTLGATNQQFAAFQNGDYTILGVEDIFANRITRQWEPNASDYDYNDVMFGFRSASVPEPTTLLLLGMGLAGVAVQRRRRA
jgi:hypothetical protein